MQKPHNKSDNKLSAVEDGEGGIILNGLSYINCETDEEALELLMLGNMNRQTANTTMNHISSRSHCIFTILINRTDSTHSTITSKMHFVDLAGSERTFKKNVSNEDSIISDSKYINLSLTFLEQVIVSIQNNSSHIPYRNSLLTSIMRDSLGGNCITSIIANVSVDESNFDETVTTLRFAQRCSQIQNNVRQCPPKIDYKAEYERLVNENEKFKECNKIVPALSSLDIKIKLQCYLKEAGCEIPFESISELKEACRIMKDLLNDKASLISNPPKTEDVNSVSEKKCNCIFRKGSVSPSLKRVLGKKSDSVASLSSSMSEVSNTYNLEDSSRLRKILGGDDVKTYKVKFKDVN